MLMKLMIMKKSIYHLALVSCALGIVLEATALTQPNLKWELSEYSTLTNGILTVDVPPGAKSALYGATAYIGLEPFEGRSLGAKVMASGENIALPANSCHGLKLMLHFQSSVSGDDCWPDAPHRIGSFGKTWLEVGDTLSGGARSSWGTIHVGLQGTSGKVVFDMNTFEIVSGESIFPRENGNYLVSYPDGVAKRPQLRGVQLPANRCTEDDFKTLAAWGATLARYQMTNAPHVQNGETPEQALPRYCAWLDAKLDHLDKEVLPWAKKYGIDIVIDLHEPPRSVLGQSHILPQLGGIVLCYQQVNYSFAFCTSTGGRAS